MRTELEHALGHEYKDRTLLETALSHTSYANEKYGNSLKSYERLEFLGDSILGYITADYLVKTFPTKHEGELTRIRADLVCEKNLSLVAEQIHLGDYLKLGNGEVQCGGRHRNSILCDVMEALIAAAYLDSGLEAAKGIIYKLILPMLTKASAVHDFKTEFQEIIQKKKDQVIEYDLVAETGPDHCKEFTVSVSVNGTLMGTGTGSSKKRAEQAAAEQALLKIH